MAPCISVCVFLFTKYLNIFVSKTKSTTILKEALSMKYTLVTDG